MDYEKHIAPLMRAKGYTRINETERTVVFTFGQMTFSRSRWRRGDRTSCPVDDWLGLEKYVRYSSYFMYHLACHASMMPYRQVCRLVKKAYGLDITKDAVLKAVKRVDSLLDDKKRY
ncbi:ISLre2 family transposase, partial [Streptococcus sp. zg-JUN1979]